AAPSPSAAPDDLDYRHRGSRVHIAARQRGADVTTWGRLIMYVPGLAASFALVATVAVYLAGAIVGWTVVAAWLFSGVLVFHRPSERLFARVVLRLRAPEPEERERLEPVWQEVIARAGIEADTYELMVENSDKLNAVAVGGHVVGVTTYALHEVPSSHLAAVLAHELGHHTGGHSWAALLGYWYSLPARVTLTVASLLSLFLVLVANAMSTLLAVGIGLVLAFFVISSAIAYWPITLALITAPIVLSYTARKGEFRADQQAVALGFGPEMAEVLRHRQAQQAAARAKAEREKPAASREDTKWPDLFGPFFPSHPGDEVRLRALEPPAPSDA
ncbi:M48 family metalloprotease, partial [Streptomyces neyagawaensis]|uniref:M48 family metalloprotease n=2 Tax=Streptomyces neyagawaensis TaxID=42238 RepID=UPI0006E2CD41